VILIHGLGGSWRWWCHNIDALAERYHVYALDFTRRARWSNGRGRVRPSESAGLLTAWMQRVGLERAHVIGHSLGGLMAIRLAAAAPERVDRLVLVDATGLPFDAGLWRLAWRAFGPAPERTREFRRMVITSNLRTNPLIVFQTARDMIRENVADLLARVAAPTLIVWGGRDPMVPVANAAALQAGIRDSRVIVVPGAGHNPMYYHPVLFNRAVLDFLAGPAADGAG
jgi:pimeloyl-ACP methyl ester carboxylesterase